MRTDKRRMRASRDDAETFLRRSREVSATYWITEGSILDDAQSLGTLHGCVGDKIWISKYRHI